MFAASQSSLRGPYQLDENKPVVRAYLTECDETLRAAQIASVPNVSVM